MTSPTSCVFSEVVGMLNIGNALIEDSLKYFPSRIDGEDYNIGSVFRV